MKEEIVMNIKIVISNSEAQKLARECGLSFLQTDSFKIKGIDVSEIIVKLDTFLEKQLNLLEKLHIHLTNSSMSTKRKDNQNRCGQHY